MIPPRPTVFYFSVVPRCGSFGIASDRHLLQVVADRCQRTGEAGIGERLRSDEVPPRNDETFAGPADEPPTGPGPTGLL